MISLAIAMDAVEPYLESLTVPHRLDYDRWWVGDGAAAYAAMVQALERATVVPREEP